EFHDQLQKPLLKRLEQKKFFVFKLEMQPATHDQPARKVRKVKEAKIRYAALCYGVPVRILKDVNLQENGAQKMRAELRRNEAAVDTELATLPLNDLKLLLTGPLNNSLYGTTNAAIFHPTNGILLVTRLDGPTPEIARGLVDKALQAETNGLWGRAYFDLRGITNGDYKLGDEWLHTASETTRRLGFETIVDTNAETFSATFPMSQIAFYAGWYDAEVSGPFTLPEVEFMPGAFAYHLHSYSAATIRSATKNWVGPLLAKGATATMGCVEEPYLSGTPDISTFVARLLAGFSFGEAAYAAQNFLSWQTTIVGDPLYRPFGKNPQLQHEDLLKRKNKLIEWSHLRVVNLNLAAGYPIREMVAYLEGQEITKRSAILMEKLGDIYREQGKPSSALYAYSQALKLNPSPQQKIRLEKLAAAPKETNAANSSSEKK
ncbi:MAG: TIGR03790 family protein, partial [Limisphaerales bacterium]